MGLSGKDIRRLSPAAQKQILRKIAKPSKYNAEKTGALMPDGTIRKFDSAKEAARYGELMLLQKAGKIKMLRLQVPFELVPEQTRDDGKTEKPVCYIADFVYNERRADGTWPEVVEDVKGYKKGVAYQLFAIKRKLMLEKYGITVKEV